MCMEAVIGWFYPKCHSRSRTPLPSLLLPVFFFTQSFTFTINATDNKSGRENKVFNTSSLILKPPNVSFYDAAAMKTSKYKKDLNSCRVSNIDFVGQSSQKCSKIFLKASQRSSAASGSHCEHLVLTLAVFILWESHCFPPLAHN